MRSFDTLFEIAADRHGGAAALEAQLSRPLTSEALAQIPDDRWLSVMTKCIFQAGFNWKVIEAKWDGFEAAFDHFDPGCCAFIDDAAFDAAQVIEIGNHPFSDLAGYGRDHGHAAGRHVDDLAWIFPAVFKHEASEYIDLDALMTPAISHLKRFASFCRSCQSGVHACFFHIRAQTAQAPG